LEDLDVVFAMQAVLVPILGRTIELDLRLPDDVEGVYADRRVIEQVLLNLCINARDAMPTGGRLTIHTENVVLNRHFCDAHSLSHPGRYVRLTLSDTGCGMPADVQERIFEPFFTTKEPGKGTGLGLAMINRVVRQHEGAICVESELGSGTTFTIYLPIAQGWLPAHERHACQAPFVEAR
jgi:signal transduction histidine kinase